MTRIPAGEPLGSRTRRPHNPDGWRSDRDDLPADQQGGGPRPPLRDNRDRGEWDLGTAIWVGLVVVAILWALGALGQQVAP